jgi:hypothetical protein
MKQSRITIAALAAALATIPHAVSSGSGPGATAPVSLENPAKGAPRGRFKQPISFHSAGQISYATGAKERDRTITLVPVEQNGVVQILETSIVDHVDDEFEYQGQLMVDATGLVWARQKEMVNAANILTVSPSIIDRLRDGHPEVVTTGTAEVSGELYDVSCKHALIGTAADRPVRVRTRTTTPDGKIDLETVAAFDQDGLPLSAATKGTIKHIMTLTVDLRLTRIASASSGGGR